MRNIFAKALISAIPLFISLFLFSPIVAAQSSEALVKEDLADVTNYMQAYKSWLAQTKAQGYGELGFTYNTTALDKIVQDCQRFYQQKNMQQTTTCLAKWDEAFSKFDQKITDSLLALDKSYLSDTLSKSSLTEIDTWIKDNEAAGYTYGDSKTTWEQLKKRVLAINAAWDTNPPYYQEQLTAWYTDYDAWINAASVSLDKQYQQMLKDAQSGTNEQHLTPFQSAQDALKKATEK